MLKSFGVLIYFIIDIFVFEKEMIKKIWIINVKIIFVYI